MLSPSTQGPIGVEKLQVYREIEELSEYMLIDPVFWRIEIYRRVANGQWELPVVCKSVDRVRFASLDFETSFRVIFEDIPPPVAEDNGGS